MEDFEYVVKKKIPPRICFGTGLDRDVLPMEGPCLSPFMRRNAPEVKPNLGPGTYNSQRSAFYELAHRIYGKFGIGPKASRWTTRHEYQPPVKEPAPKEPIPLNCAPFNSTSRRKPLFKASSYPAPCDYCPDIKKKEMKFAYSFSGKKVLRCAVEIKCVPYNLDACAMCGCSCSAQGDYWQFENRIFLCRRHYSRLFQHCLDRFQGVKLADFKKIIGATNEIRRGLTSGAVKSGLRHRMRVCARNRGVHMEHVLYTPIRDCFFAHAHNSCKAALKIMKVEEIQKKLRKEAYLDVYFPQRRLCNN